MIIEGDCLEVMKTMEDNSISCIVTDPPYGLSFMGKQWDAGLPHDEIWKEALRIVKPGGHILAFGGTRTYHRLTCAVEDAGWEIRDCIMWIYGSGFPKSHNHFGLEGYGTALKPAHEPIIMAMKPCDGTFAQNAQKWGQGGININECRIEALDQDKLAKNWDREKISDMRGGNYKKSIASGISSYKSAPMGRWPANVLFDEEAARVLDEQSGISKSVIRPATIGFKSGDVYAGGWNDKGYERDVNDSGGASRFFYCAKASSNEREEFNKHPTVKPLKLMEYLIKLVMPPKDGILLDPFAGSGTTIVAAHRQGFKAIGIEKQPEYCEIARGRLENSLKEKVQSQLDLFTKVG